jgi:tRNA pseudouridine38-40 synthase
VNVVCAGRTDAGVHALEQVVHFDTSAERRLRGWVLGTNTLLPQDIAVLWARRVSLDFHARYAAQARRYRYIILNRPARPGLDSQRVSGHFQPLDAELMQSAGQQLLGEHDFSAFRARHCQSRTPWRCVHEVRVWREADRVLIEIEANAFLHHMVRNIVGVLMVIGRGEQPVVWAAQVLASRDRTQAAITAPAAGLYLQAVRYPVHWALPLGQSELSD